MPAVMMLATVFVLPKAAQPGDRRTKRQSRHANNCPMFGPDGIAASWPKWPILENPVQLETTLQTYNRYYIIY